MIEFTYLGETRVILSKITLKYKAVHEAISILKEPQKIDYGP